MSTLHPEAHQSLKLTFLLVVVVIAFAMTDLYLLESGIAKNETQSFSISLVIIAFVVFLIEQVARTLRRTKAPSSNQEEVREDFFEED